MDIKEINSYGQELVKCLKLTTSPVAVKLVPKGVEVPEGIKKVDEAMRHCQLVDRVQYFTNWIRKSSSFIPISKYFSVKCLKS